MSRIGLTNTARAWPRDITSWRTRSPVPSYWPDTEAVRNDMLDYAFEIAHFDRQLGRMVDLLAEKGLLDNTLVVATSDNGPPFPRMKGHPFESSLPPAAGDDVAQGHRRARAQERRAGQLH